MFKYFFRFISSIFHYVFEELADSGHSNTRLEPTIGAIANTHDEKELPPIKMD
ncbi:MAG: hypothetical protein LJE85_16465 [Gammaproteobacteria bacterium]|nr:hypothetical protein [Gammaproteobacteria bacterium]